MNFNIFEIVYQIMFFSLLILGAVSFTFFIRRILINSNSKKDINHNIENKLDKIIELLEKDRNK
jgi:hypothetical protein